MINELLKFVFFLFYIDTDIQKFVTKCYLFEDLAQQSNVEKDLLRIEKVIKMGNVA